MIWPASTVQHSMFVVQRYIVDSGKQMSLLNDNHTRVNRLVMMFDLAAGDHNRRIACPENGLTTYREYRVDHSIIKPDLG